MRFDRDGTLLWPLPKLKARWAAVCSDSVRWGKTQDSTKHRYSQLFFFLPLQKKKTHQYISVLIPFFFCHFLRRFLYPFPQNSAIILSSNLLAAKMYFSSLFSINFSFPPPYHRPTSSFRLTDWWLPLLPRSSRLLPTNSHQDNKFINTSL